MTINIEYEAEEKLDLDYEKIITDVVNEAVDYEKILANDYGNNFDNCKLIII